MLSLEQLRQIHYNVELATCPNCSAKCLLGHDDDGQVFCAKCLSTFVPTAINTVTDEQFQQMIKKGSKRFEHTGWVAYTLENK